MKKALIYTLSLALLLVVVLVACNKPQADQPAKPQEPDPAASTSAPTDVSTPEPVKDSTPEPPAKITPEPEPEQAPTAPAESEDTQPPEDTKPQEPAQEQTTEPPKETKPTTQSSGGGTTQTKPQGQQGQQGQTQQQGQQNQQPTGDTSGRPADFDDQLKQILDNNYTPDYSKGPLTADEKAGIADAISGRGGQTQGNPSGKTPEQVKAEEEATQKALDDMLNDWLSGN